MEYTIVTLAILLFLSLIVATAYIYKYTDAMNILEDTHNQTKKYLDLYEDALHRSENKSKIIRELKEENDILQNIIKDQFVDSGITLSKIEEYTIDNVQAILSTNKRPDEIDKDKIKRELIFMMCNDLINHMEIESEIGPRCMETIFRGTIKTIRR